MVKNDLNHFIRLIINPHLVILTICTGSLVTFAFSMYSFPDDVGKLFSSFIMLVQAVGIDKNLHRLVQPPFLVGETMFVYSN